MQLHKLLLLLLLLFIAAPSSALAILPKNCSVAQARYVLRDHGGLPVLVPPMKASTLAEPLTSTPVLTFITTLSSAPAVHSSTSTSTLLIPEPPISVTMMATSVPMATSLSVMTVSPLAISDPLASTPTLHPISAPLGTIITMPSLFTPADPTVTIPSSNLASLDHNTSTTAPSTAASSHPTASATATPTLLPASQAQIFVIVGAVGIALGIFGLGLIGIAWLRRSARKTRARALRREVELVEVVVPRGAVAVRDDILNRQAGVPQREAAAERNDESGTDVSAREYVGEGAGKGDREGWETLPAYHR